MNSVQLLSSSATTSPRRTPLSRSPAESAFTRRWSSAFVSVRSPAVSTTLSGRRWAWWSRLEAKFSMSAALALHQARDDVALDLAGALADLEDLGVGVQPGDLRLDHPAVAAVHLHAGARDPVRRLGGVELRHRRLL